MGRVAARAIESGLSSGERSRWGGLDEAGGGFGDSRGWTKTAGDTLRKREREIRPSDGSWTGPAGFAVSEAARNWRGQCAGGKQRGGGGICRDGGNRAVARIFLGGRGDSPRPLPRTS